MIDDVIEIIKPDAACKKILLAFFNSYYSGGLLAEYPPYTDYYFVLCGREHFWYQCLSGEGSSELRIRIQPNMAPLLYDKKFNDYFDFTIDKQAKSLEKF